MPEEQSAHTIPQLHRQNTLQSDPDNPNHLFDTQTPPQPNPFSHQIFHTPDSHQINPSDTITIHNTSELSEENEQPEEQTTQLVQNTQSLTTSTDSNLIQIPTHNITTEDNTNQHQDTTSTTTHDHTSLLSTSQTNITHSPQTQGPFQQNYDPPPLPSQFANSDTTHNSPQQCSSFCSKHTYSTLSNHHSTFTSSNTNFNLYSRSK